MAERAYLISEEFGRRLKDTVARVQGDVQSSQMMSASAVPGEGAQRGAPHYLSKTTSAWSKGSSQTLTLWGGTPGSEAAVSGQTVEAWNKFSNIKANKWVMLARCNGAFYVISAEC